MMSNSGDKDCVVQWIQDSWKCNTILEIYIRRSEASPTGETAYDVYVFIACHHTKHINQILKIYQTKIFRKPFFHFYIECHAEKQNIFQSTYPHGTVIIHLKSTHNHHGRFDYFKWYAIHSELSINQSNGLVGSNSHCCIPYSDEDGQSIWRFYVAVQSEIESGMDAQTRSLLIYLGW
jgi:hypothetical protein